MTSFEDAFDGLYRKAYHVAYCVLGSRESAEDAAQEALARTFLHWPRASEHPEGWVARVSANVAIGMLRRSRRRLLRPHVEVAAPMPDVPSADRLELQEALRSLPRRQRQVVVLRYLADLPEAEVAAVIGCSVGAVKQHASRGLSALRARLDANA
jgi:RNA polymerase sigma-70 factor (sigma-E family)